MSKFGVICSFTLLIGAYVTILGLSQTVVAQTPSQLSADPCDDSGLCQIRDETDEQTRTYCNSQQQALVTKYGAQADASYSKADIEYSLYRACFVGNNAALRNLDAAEAGPACESSVFLAGKDDMKIDLPLACQDAYKAGGGAALPPTTEKEKCETNDQARFLTAPAWYRGVVDKETCTITAGAVGGDTTKFLIIIALNLVEILMNIVGYIAVVFVIVSGYKFMTSVGSADGIVKGRTTLRNAVIGLLISILAVGIVNLVTAGL